MKHEDEFISVSSKKVHHDMSSKKVQQSCFVSPSLTDDLLFSKFIKEL